MLNLLQPVQSAAEKSAFVKELVASGELFHPVAWTPKEAYAFLQEVPVLEASGVVVRLPDWWHARRPPRPQVKVSVGTKAPGGVGMDAMLDFRVALTLDDETITPAEWKRILAGTDNLVMLKGKWVEIDRDKLQQVLDQWKAAERGAREGVSFLEGMRLLSGVSAGLGGGVSAAAAAAVDARRGGALARRGARRSEPAARQPRGRSRRRAQGHAAALPARRHRLAVAPLAPRPGGVPRRRHGARQDHPGARAAAPARAEGGSRAAPPGRARLAPRQLARRRWRASRPACGRWCSTPRR